MLDRLRSTGYLIRVTNTIGVDMTDNDHNAFVSTYDGGECENPFDEVMFEWDDWEDEEGSDWWL
mgnify:FL=1